MRAARLPAAALALALAGCGPPDPRSVDEYAADPVLREAALSRCNLDRLYSRDDPDCINARRAAREREIIEWAPADPADGAPLREVVDDQRPLREAPAPEAGSTPVERSDTRDASDEPRKD